ncbi:MAG TPA: CheR family methyltransferase, partial [Thermoanaerobaculia bacterium]|nr:CheR family methyltransferase [Thermoanaerobaculia bacterium]
LPPEGIARELARIGSHPYVSPSPKPKPDESRPIGTAQEKILTLLHTATGVDFRNYRQSTISRRISRRMILHRIERLEDYLQYLKKNPAGVRTLFEDILIRVTGFFRDQESFAALEKQVLPALLKNRAPSSAVRVWVPGCATGEEVYSIGICLFEALAAAGINPPVLIFGTDISEAAIDKARAGTYLENAVVDVAPERLKRFFTKVEGGYQISKTLRDVCIFAKQNVATDPPFSNLDLLSCRNLLIYLEPVLQNRIIPYFHYALKPNGFLMLGSSETIGGFGSLFVPFDRGNRIFVKKEGSPRQILDLGHRPSPQEREGEARQEQLRDLGLQHFDLQKEADRLVLSRYAPAGVLINDAMEVLQFRGRTSPYLEAAPGNASFNVLRMAREGLLVELRAAIQKAKKKGEPVRTENVRIRQNGRALRVDLEVIPIRKGSSGERNYLILFEEREGPAANRPRVVHHAPDPRTAARRVEEDTLAKLEGELAQTKEYLQAIIEEQEASNEELKSANEEILSSNEELQSTNEELETAKEELQSTNEELRTVNDELQTKNDEAAQLSNDLSNTLTGTDMAIVMVGVDGRIRRFTPMAEKLLNLIPTDVGRSIRDIKPEVNVADLDELAHSVVETATTKESEVRSRDGRWYQMRVRPYRTLDNRIEGAVILFQDIDPIKKSLGEANRARGYAEALVETVRESLVVLDDALRVRTANRAFYETFQTSPDQTEGKRLFARSERDAGSSRLSEVLKGVDSNRDGLKNVELAIEFEKLGLKTLLFNARRVPLPGEEKPLILLAIADITERKRAEEELRQVQKLESLGRLSGGIAHDFNNLLNIVSAYSALLARDEEDSRKKDHLAAINKAVDRGAALVGQLLTFARRSESRLEALDVNAVVEDELKLLSETFSKKFEIKFELDQNLPPIAADSNQIHQALLNLCVNARDAMPDGGRIVIRTSVVPGRNIRQKFPDARNKRYVMLAVTDNGPGMNAETRSRIFEPFFTTKEKGRGVGLGLALVYGIVKGHSGFIDVDTKFGKGTEFRIYLPAGAVKIETPAPETRPPEEAVINGGSETILFAEDEEDLASAVRSLLESEGYSVLLARDGLEALELYSRRKKEIAVSIIDLQMPRLGGFETYLKMKEIDPAVKVIIASGNLGSDQKNEMKDAGIRASLHKPYTAQDIMRKVRRVLDG